MNRQFATVLLLSAIALPAVAQESTPTLSSVEVRGALYVSDCSHRALPSQREVGEWTDSHNLGQAYAARERLLADISRVCKRPGVARVQVVRQQAESGDGARYVAVALPAGR